jgi:D-glycero-D-manno-heptose 1,7-bisphosphate phosphatase
MFSDLQLIILDRDGVINHDSADYIKSADEWIPIPGSLEAIAQLNQAGFIVAIATNQSGIGRGYYSEQTLLQMHEKMDRLLAPLQGRIDAIRYCPHGPDSGCACRKPNSGMIEDLMHHFEVLPQQTLVVGDAFRDIQAGKNLGCHTALVLTGKGQETKKKHQDELKDIAVFLDLQNLVDNLIK